MPRSITILLAVCIVFAAGSVAWLLQRDTNPNQDTGSDLRSPFSLTRPVSSSNLAKSPWAKLTDDDLPTHQRLEIARQISDSLNNEHTIALFDALDHRPRSGAEDDWYLILNEIMEQMRRQGLGQDDYSVRLGKIVSDSSRPSVVRDYAIQHLALWIAPGNPDQVPHEKDPVLIEESLATISTVLQGSTVSNTSIPGTALLALAGISQHLPSEMSTATWASLEAYLHGLISGTASPQLSTRVSAIQAVSLTAQQPYLPAIRSYAASDTENLSVRLSSIASLGIYADPKDYALLKTLATQDSRYQYAAQAALKRFENR